MFELLNSKGVLTVHGFGFGTKYGRDHFRLVFLLEKYSSASSLDKIEEFVS